MRRVIGIPGSPVGAIWPGDEPFALLRRPTSGQPLIGTVINIPAASAETVAASVTVVGSAFLSNLLAPATAARKRGEAGLVCWRHRG